MLNCVPALSPHVDKALQTFREAGVALSDAEVVWLATLRRDCDKPRDGDLPEVWGAALHYAGRTFYPMHRLAETWFLRAFKLTSGTELLPAAAFIFAHERSATGDTSLREYSTTAQVSEVLSEYLDNLPIHSAQIAPLCDALSDLDGNPYSVPEIKDGDASSSSTDTFISTMCKAFPGTLPDYWLTGLPSAKARAILEAASDEGTDFATSFDRTEAIKNWLRAIKLIWKDRDNA